MNSGSASESSGSENTKSVLSWLKSVPPAIDDFILPNPQSRSSIFLKWDHSSSLNFASPLHLSPTKRRRFSDPVDTMGPRHKIIDLPKVPGFGAANPGSGDTKKIKKASDNLTSASSKVSGFLSSKQSSDPRSIGNRMTAHGLILNDIKAFERYPKFQNKVYGIIDKHRLKDPHPASEKKLRVYLEEYDRASEATLLLHIIPILLKDGFYTREQEQAVFRELLVDEGIVINRDEELRGTLLPNRYMNQGFEEEMEKDLKKGDKMKNAKPDYIFGITVKRFFPTSQVPTPRVINNLLTIAPGMYHPFLIIEGKGDQGSTAQAEDQCRRGGSTLVHATRILSEEIGHSKPEQGRDDEQTVQQHSTEQQQLKITEPAENADIDTFVYSVTISPRVVEFYVNWYEKNQKDIKGISNPLFHMNLVKSISLNDRKALKEIRHTLHNICEWGANERFSERMRLHERLSDFTYELYNTKNQDYMESKKRKTGKDTFS